MNTSNQNLQTIQQQQQRLGQVALNEHVLTIETLVAELELNTDTTVGVN